MFTELAAHGEAWQDPDLLRPPTGRIWRRVDELVDTAPRASDLLDHRLHLFGARRRRARGETVPADLVAAERMNALLAMMTPHVLRRIREAVEGPVLLIKGPEVAARYPDPLLRPFIDLDILVPDAPTAQRQLLAAGFEESGEPDLYRDIHHLRPVHLGELPLPIEVHSEPKWPKGTTAPPTGELIAAAVPSATGVPGISAPSLEQHVLLLAAHSWAHEPLRRLLELVDISVMAAGADRAAIAAQADRWGIGRVWETTIAAADALFDGGPSPLALRLWARHLERVRGRTVLESHLQRWIGSFWSDPPGTALRRSVRAVAEDLAPKAGEGWRRKLQRTGLAIVNSGRRRAEHEDIVGRRSRRPR